MNDQRGQPTEHWRPGMRYGRGRRRAIIGGVAALVVAGGYLMASGGQEPAGDMSDPAVAETATSDAEVAALPAPPPSTTEEQPAKAPTTTTDEPEARRAPPERPERSDAEKEAAFRFFEQTDDDAIALEETIGEAIDGDPQAGTRIAALRDSIGERMRTYSDSSPASRVLVTIAERALSALRLGDVRALIRERVRVWDARHQLAAEIVG